MDLERDDLQGADDLAVKADERRMEMRRGKIIAVSLTVCAVGAGMTVNAYAASTTFEMRKKAVSLLGIITTSNYQANVTRGEFAELLVKASDYKEAANAAGTVSVFADVSSKSQYSAAIRTAATNSWMSGYLGGNFKPDEGVTMRDAIKAVLAVLGVVCSKRLLNQAVGKSLRTHNLKPKKGAQVMRKNEKITALYERLSRD
ncbi:MAG: S-layer homology domain-containing protein, partial [Candidatus Copromonas sp.]|nr:S-layer homology domain-containing protein [Candidatus Copromonas sp.]